MLIAGPRRQRQAGRRRVLPPARTPGRATASQVHDARTAADAPTASSRCGRCRRTQLPTDIYSLRGPRAARARHVRRPFDPSQRALPRQRGRDGRARVANPLRTRKTGRPYHCADVVERARVVQPAAHRAGARRARAGARALAALVRTPPAGEGRAVLIEGPAGHRQEPPARGGAPPRPRPRRAGAGRARQRARARLPVRRRAPAVRGRAGRPGAARARASPAPRRRRAPCSARSATTPATARRRVVRGAARPLLARGQPRRRPAAGARDRRPALVRPPVAALPGLPRAPARGPADPVAATLRTGEPGDDAALLGEIAHDPADGRRAARRRSAPRPSRDAHRRAARRRARPRLLRRLPPRHGRQPAAAARAADGARGRRRAPGRRARRASCSTSARAPSRARCCCGSPACRADAVAVARAVAVLGESADAAPPSPRSPGLDEARRGRGHRRARPRRDPARPSAARLRAPAGARRGLPRAAARRARARSTRAPRDVLRDAGAPAEQVAAQLLRRRRGAARRGSSTRCARRAARRATRGAAESAVAYLQRALEEPPPPSARPRLLLELGLAEGSPTGRAAAEHLREAYDALTDPQARALAATCWPARAVHRAAPAEAARVRPRGGRGAARRSSQDERRAAARRSSCMPRIFGARRAERDCAGSTPYRDAPARRAARRRARAMLAGLAAWDWVHERRPRRRRAPSSRWRALAERRAAQPPTTACSRSPPLVALADLRDRDEALEVWDDRARRRAPPRLAVRHLGPPPLARLRAAAARRAGRGRGVAAPGARGVRRPGVRRAAACVYTASFLARALLGRGDLAAARAGARPRAATPASDSDGSRLLARHASWSCCSPRGAHEEALAAARGLSTRFRARRATRPLVPWRAAAARGARRARPRATRRVPLAEEELALARRWGAPCALGPRAARARHAAARRRPARPARRRSTCSSGSRRPARARRGAGRARRGAAARPPARRRARAAAPRARAGRRLRRRRRSSSTCAPSCTPTGARPRTTALGGVEALTASERRVARSRPRASTNRDIAQALFVTPKTVEVHLSNAYRKLGVRSRRELAGALGA